MGSLGVSRLEIPDTHSNDEKAKAWLKATLPRYWPVYYNAAMYHIDGDNHTLVVNYKTDVVATEVVI
jgi:hypothetical protein